MKMEVLSVQNQFQGHQFGVLGSNKVKDWAQILTPPATKDNLTNGGGDEGDTSSDLVVKPSIIQNSNKNDDQFINALSMRLQDELRTAKSRHLACTEVLLPSDLLHRISADIIKASEREPCGIRGCSIYIEFEDEPSNTRRIASLKVDPDTVSTFELYLTLKHDRSGWKSILPQFLKNLARSSTIMISPEFNLTKNKLYLHSFYE